MPLAIRSSKGSGRAVREPPLHHEPVGPEAFEEVLAAQDEVDFELRGAAPVVQVPAGVARVDVGPQLVKGEVLEGVPQICLGTNMEPPVALVDVCHDKRRLCRQGPSPAPALPDEWRPYDVASPAPRGEPADRGSTAPGSSRRQGHDRGRSQRFAHPGLVTGPCVADVGGKSSRPHCAASRG